MSDENGIRRDVLEKCRELNPPILRFPGGTVIGIYHWEDHIGPVSQRKKGRNLIWGGRLCHEFGTAEYITYCRAIGAEPMICVNMPTGSAEEAAHWVEYCNGTEDTYYANLRRSHGYEEPFNVKYWCIGNESSAEPDLGWQHDVNIYIREAWEFTKYMKLTDPSIKLVFAGGNETWNRAILDSLHPVCDYLSLHYYTDLPHYENICNFEASELIPLEKLLDEYNEKEIVFSPWYRFPHRTDPIRIALDEWGIWSSAIATEESAYGLARRYDWKSALWFAKFMNMMIRHSNRVKIANLAQMVNVIAPIIADHNGSYRQTVFFPLRNYRAACGSTLVSIEYDHSELDMVATMTEDGKYVVFAVNTASSPAEIEFEEKVSVFSALRCDNLGSINDAATNCVQEHVTYPDTTTVALPAYSICVITLK